MTFFARWYTSARWSREYGSSSVSRSMKYWRISGPIDSSP
jgi:hypothetical protein